MTLVISEVSKFGIVMAADTAESTTVTAASGRQYTRTRFGRKLFPIQYLNGGASHWGAGEIHTGGGLGRIPSDVWLEDFIEREGVEKPEEFAYTLRHAVRVLHGSEGPLLGFQVSGIDSANTAQLGQSYRISNHDKIGGKPEFDVETVANFPRLNEEPTVFADGDEALYLGIGSELRKAACGPDVAIPFRVRA